jgi:hypothetical protein
MAKAVRAFLFMENQSLDVLRKNHISFRNCKLNVQDAPTEVKNSLGIDV